jgi:hypothetical protein
MEEINCQYKFELPLTYPKLEWIEGNKYGITPYSNGVVIRKPNVRVTIMETELNGEPCYEKIIQQIWDRELEDVDHPLLQFRKVRGNYYISQSFLRKDTYEMIIWGMNFLLDESKYCGTYTHNGKPNNEEE